MPRNLQLLKQVRATAASVAMTTENSLHRNLLSMADLFLNELMLQDSSAFYLDYLRRGKAMLEEGRGLVASVGKVAPPAAALRDDLNEESRIEVIDAQIAALFSALSEVVRAIDENRSAREKDYLVRLSDWESSLYAHRLVQAEGQRKESTPAISATAFQSYLREKFPQWRELRVVNFTALEGGLSKKTYLVDIEDAVNGVQSLAIRAEQPVELLPIAGSDLAREFPLIRLMHQLGMPGPAALWFEEDTGKLGMRFIVSRKVEGKIIGGTMGSTKAVSEEELASIMNAFFRMHNIRLDPADPLARMSHLGEWLPHRTIRDAALYAATEYMPQMIRRAGIETSPQLLRALCWLERNVPDCDETPVIVHNDFAYNNILVHENRVSAVLDWETSRLGDPADDIIWTQQNLGVYAMPEFLRRYREGTGRGVSAYRIAYARVVKCVWTIISCFNALHAIDVDDNTPPQLGVAAFKIMPMLASNVGELIAAAEAARRS